MLNLSQGGLNLPVINVDMLVTVAGNGHAANATKSGDPVLVGNIPGVAIGDLDANNSNLTPVCTSCIARLTVKGITTGGGNGAISVGDIVYMQTDGTLDKNSSGAGAIKFGTAFGNDETGATGVDTRTGVVVASGNTTTVIRVWVGKIN